MSRNKNQVVTIRTTSHVKALLRLAAARERRSVASMMETLVYAYAEQHKLEAIEAPPPQQQQKKRQTS